MSDDKFKEIAKQHLRRTVQKYLRLHRKAGAQRTPLLADIRTAAKAAENAGISPEEADAIIMAEVRRWYDKA